MNQPRLQRKFAVKLAQTTKELFRLDPVSGNHFAFNGKTAIGLRRWFESDIMSRNTILAAKNCVRFRLQLAHGITEQRQVFRFFRGLEQHEGRCCPWA